MQAKFGRTRVLARVLALATLGLLTLQPARAISLYFQATQAAERAMLAIAEEVQRSRHEAFSERWANQMRDKVRAAGGQFRSAFEELELEIARLETRPEENAELLAELRRVKQQSLAAKDRLVKLNQLMIDTETLKNAKTSGHLERTLRDVAEALNQVAGQMEETQETLSTVGDEDWQPGFVEIRELTVTEGEMKLYMSRGGRDDEEVRVGSQVRIDQLPIRIRACVQDEQKQRLTERKRNPPSTIEFHEVDGTPGHKFEYTGTSGTSTWTVKERYRFTPDPRADDNSRIRAWAQRSSDGATEPSSGDVLEIHTSGPVAQNLTFDVEGEVLYWRRSSDLHRDTSHQETPQGNRARARLVLSLFPR